MRFLTVLLAVVFANISFAQVATPNICLVSVDSNSTHNYVVWEKPITGAIDYYNIYYDNGSGSPVLLGNRDYDSLSIYRDFTNDPNVDSVTYYLSAVDTFGVETAMSAPHSTMYLNIAHNGQGGVMCSWSHYWGRSVSSYQCWRDTAINDTWEMIFASGSGAQSGWNDNNMPGTSSMRYFLKTEWGSVCTISRANNDFNSSRSNRTSTISNPQVPQDLKDFPIIVTALYPNPTSDVLYVEGTQQFGEITGVKIYDPAGRLVDEQTVNPVNGSFKLEISTLTLRPGNYLMEINSTRGVYHQKFLKE